jgi:hypothetical protein
LVLFPTTARPDLGLTLWVPRSLYSGLRSQSGLTTHPHLVSRARIYGVVLSLPLHVHGVVFKNRENFVRFQILTAASIKTGFWDVAPCSLVEADRRSEVRTAVIVMNN